MVVADAALVAATALHAGFQLVVTLLVYPALAESPAATWTRAHAAHSRRITPVVAVVYAGLVAAGTVVVLDGPSPAQTLAVAASGLALVVTAAVAAPAHGRLGESKDPDVLRRLLRADRLRCGAAVVSAASALAGALS